MELVIQNKYTIIKEPTDAFRKICRDEFIISDQRTAFRGGGFDASLIKKIPFFANKKGSIVFFTGMLFDILMVIKEYKVKITMIDQRVRLPYQEKEYSYDEMRSYFNPDFTYVEHQIRALKKMLSQSRGIIKATTSSGKSEIMLAFCKMVGLKVLILVNKQDLGIQTARRFNEGGFPVVYRGSNKKGKIDENASYVCTIGLANELPNDFDVVIIDECHRASSKTFQEYLFKSKAKAFYGFSATPEGNHKVDFTKVKQHTGHIIEEIDAQEMLENEVIVFPEITFIENIVPGTIDWPSANELCIMRNEIRNELIANLVEKHGLPTLILVKNIEHGEILNKLIPNSIFVSGCKSSEDRQEAIKNFDTGETTTLIATNIFNEGISINIIRVLIIASGGKSKIETTQKLGRGLRKDEGKEKVLVFDFYDLGNKFCQRHSESRMKIYKKVGFPVNVIQE